MFLRLSALLHLGVVQFKISHISNAFILVLFLAVIFGRNRNLQFPALVLLIWIFQRVPTLTTILLVCCRRGVDLIIVCCCGLLVIHENWLLLRLVQNVTEGRFVCPNRVVGRWLSRICGLLDWRRDRWSLNLREIVASSSWSSTCLGLLLLLFNSFRWRNFFKLNFYWLSGNYEATNFSRSRNWTHFFIFGRPFLRFKF